MRTQVHTLAAKNGAAAFLEAHTGIVAAPVPQQFTLEFYAPPPDPVGHTWHAFTLDTKEKEAAGAFLRRYGRPPEFVFESRGNLLCGPIPSEVTS